MLKIKHLKRVPYIEQLQQTECGLCCVAMLLRYYKSHESMTKLRNSMEVGRDGLKLSFLSNYLKYRGFETKIYKAVSESLKDLPLPAVIFWENEHFVILDKMQKGYVEIVDPAFGRRKMTLKLFKESYSEVVMTVQPGEAFVPVKESSNVWIKLAKSLKNSRSLFLKLFLISIITYGLQLVMPILTQNLIDIVLTGGKKEEAFVYLYWIVALVTVYGLSTYQQGRKLLDTQVSIDANLNNRTFTKLLRLPYKYFESRSNGDMLFRLSSLGTIRSLLSEQVIQGILQLGSIFFILCYMFSKSVLLAGIALLILSISGAFILYMRPLLMESNQNEIVETTKLHSIQVEAIYAIFGIKTSGIEDHVCRNWEKRYDRSMYIYEQKNNLLNVYSTVISLIKTVGPMIILFVGILEFFSSRLSVGEAIALYSLANSMLSTSVSAFNVWNDFTLATAYLERLEDILSAEEEKIPDSPVEVKISGDIILENVSFAYTNKSKNVLNNLNLKIRKGENVAVVGTSGSGKSTLTKLLLGLYLPTAGEILYDGVNAEYIDKSHLRKQIGIVPQDMSLFNKSILENITMGNSKISLNEVKRAARIAMIQEDIEKMPMNYHTLVSDLGMNLSGGQKQRIILARALLNSPHLLILDEATSSLDNVNEKKVANFLNHSGCTRITVAHRLSTIQDADKIIVLDKGEIAEIGTHNELLKKQGIYAKLYESRMKQNVS